MMIDQTLRDELHAELLQEQARLTGEIQGISGSGGIDSEVFQDDETDAVDQHPADDGSELFEREKNMTVQRTLEIELENIAQALQKFEDGTYGMCEVCGKPIPEARLRAYPAATRDVACQEKMDRTGRVVSTNA
jgi:RNA polymerase-binding transcription factor DksA